MGYRKNNSSIDTMAVLLLYLLFSMLVIFTFVAGIKAYHSVRNRNHNNYALRTTLQYVSNKVKAYQSKGAVSAGKINGRDALIIKEEIDGRLFHTYIYEDKNKLYELFIEDNTQIDLSWGVEINSIEKFDLEKLSDDLVLIDSGASVPLIINVS